MSTKFVGALAAVALALSTTMAFAFVPFNIDVIKNANVYSNRTMQSNVVNKVKAGDTVKVMQIRTTWCYIQIPGKDGWVKCANLAPFI